MSAKSLCRALPLLVFLTMPGSAQLAVVGVTDKTVYSDYVTLEVPAEAGFSYSVTLNGTNVAAGEQISVMQPDYYELRVERTDGSTGVITNRLVRFIVKDSSRADTEWGLPTQTPLPVVQSCSNEFAEARLLVIAPREFPMGYDIPVVIWVEDANAHAIRANGLVKAAGQKPIQVRRGVGSGLLTGTNAAGTLNYAPVLQGVSTNKAITIEAETTWTAVSGTLSGAVEWPADSRVHVTTNLIISAGATLTIGAGTIVRLNYRTDITNNGALVINGTVEEPVVFMPESTDRPWGGFLMRNGTGSISGTGVLFTGSGAVPNWFGSSGNPSSHRSEQALFFLQQGQTVALKDSAAMYLAGQLGHAVGGGTFTFERFLMQHTTTGGEFTGANFTVNDSAFIECPEDSARFVDGDNDALYLVNGTHWFTNTLFGWTKDDGIDSGASGAGRLHYERCWFESIFHEGVALSGLKDTTAHETVYLDCGQGLEDGYGASTGGPTGRVDRCVFAYCQVGARHGDNYPSIGDYQGIIAASNSIFLHNHHDLFGYDWRASAWTNAVDQMFFQNNLLTLPDPAFPQNGVWEPARDAGLLGFAGAGGRVGLGFAVRPGQTATDFPYSVPVVLSMFCTNEVTVEYAVQSSDKKSGAGTLHFAPGELRQAILLPTFTGVVQVMLKNASNADITSVDRLYFQNFPDETKTVLVAFGSRWKYLDDGSDQGTAWRMNDFDDSKWASGLGQLGFGDQDERTPLSPTNSAGKTNITFYFRAPVQVADPVLFNSVQLQLLRDDGGVVYIHGQEVFRSTNMPSGTIRFDTFANATGENTVDTTNLPPTVLQPGTNVVAVEIHQQALTSSDVSFDLELVGNPVPLVPRLESYAFSDELVLYWADAGLQLECSDEVTGAVWQPVAAPSPVAVVPSATRQFYRLRK